MIPICVEFSSPQLGFSCFGHHRMGFAHLILFSVIEDITFGEECNTRFKNDEKRHQNHEKVQLDALDSPHYMNMTKTRFAKARGKTFQSSLQTSILAKFA